MIKAIRFRCSISHTYHALLARKITQYVDAHITEDLSLTHLSSRFGYSQSYISTIFHNRTGESLQQYVIQKRMKQIESLIRLCFGSKQPFNP